MSDEAPPAPRDSYDRRELARRAALGALAAGVAASSVRAEEPKSSTEPASSSPADSNTREADALSAAPIAALVAEAIRRSALDKLTPEIVAKITRDVERLLQRSRVLASVPLANGDEPATVFRAYRGPELPKL